MLRARMCALPRAEFDEENTRAESFDNCAHLATHQTVLGQIPKYRDHLK